MKQSRLKRSHLSFLIIAGTLTILMFILVTAVVIFFLTNQTNAAEPAGRSLLVNRRPLEVDQVDPALALASLGGFSNGTLVKEAIDKARPETAFATLLFEPDLSDRESAGGFLLVATAYTERQEPAKAIFCYEMAGTITTLSPDIPDTARTDLFIQIGEGLIGLNEVSLAKFYLDQAFLLASRSPFLQVAQRRAIFERLQKNYIALGDRETARTSLDLSASPPDVEFSADEGMMLPKGEPILLPPELQEAETRRWIAAQELAAQLVERGGRAPAATEETVKQALLAEDALKLSYFEAELANEASLAKRIDITAAKIEWLSTKYRMARQAYGRNIVPEWVAEAEQIRADLTKAYEALYALYADLIVALPEATQIDKATEERLRREILAGELGRYPNYPEQQRQKQLLEISEKLIGTQPELNVFVGASRLGNRELYNFISQ